MELEKRVDVWLKDTSKKLDISNLGLKKWPNALKGTQSALTGKEDLVVKLTCSYNALVSLPLLPNLTKLWCYNNQLTSLPLFPKLTHLRCWNNQLTSLPILPNLTNLKCSRNQLTSLPIFPNLTDLSCTHNQLTSLPLLFNLTKLSCSYNQLTYLPLFLNLTLLYCSNNQLTSLPLRLPNLTILGCENNKLTSLPLRLPNLIELDCDDNQLTFLPLFHNLTELCCSTNKNLFSNNLAGWKKVWRLKTVRSNEIRRRGLKRVVRVLKNRLYLPRLNQLKQELIYSPNHPGKFYKNLRVGNWSFEATTKLTNLNK